MSKTIESGMESELLKSGWNPIGGKSNNACFKASLRKLIEKLGGILFNFKLYPKTLEYEKITSAGIPICI
ncbi:MAG TPA: hypothetical protein DIW07_16405, partial [Lachnospiraceae bacterium]|nr:hypothetical protein [Lachnospiraceae bacterium]